MSSAREYNPKQIELAVNTIKTLSIEAVEKANSGHPGTPMGLADISFELFTRYLRYDPKDPGWLGRDRFDRLEKSDPEGAAELSAMLCRLAARRCVETAERLGRWRIMAGPA